MKIACLQFAPRVGDFDNNINRADAVLSKANSSDLDGLDLLVLPELAFTGYNFKSLQQIFPFFEETGSGITSLWARTTALKYDCTVVVGYPEQVDVSAKWPTSPEYYNSALVVDGAGDYVGNYRKSFLYYTDETWALEGQHGFFKGRMPGLGTVALGICTDLNPYKLEAPWDAFEFGFHVLKAHANLVILTMAWQTHEDAVVFHRSPEEPDLDTLVYWVQRLEPLIRANREEEVIVVFCNRTGTEGEVTYTGTSAVIGIKRGEVYVYGVLGRGENELLVVDTSQPPRTKLTAAEAETEEHIVEKPPVDKSLSALNTKISTRHRHHSPDNVEEDECEICQCCFTDSGVNLAPNSPQKPTSPRFPWLAAPLDSPIDSPVDSRSPTRLQIPIRPVFDDIPTCIDSAVTDDIITNTPAPPGFPASPAFRRGTPLRPKPASPSPWRFQRTTSPYPWHHHDGSHSAVFGSGACLTPITPFDEDGWIGTPIEKQGPPGWFWRHEPTLAALRENVKEEEEEGEMGGTEKTTESTGSISAKKDENPVAVEPEEGSGYQAAQPLATRFVSEEEDKPVPVELAEIISREGNDDETEEEMDAPEEQPEPWPEASSEEQPGNGPLDNDWAGLADVLETLRNRPTSAFDFRSSLTDRPCSPKSSNVSRNASRNGSPFRVFQLSELGQAEDELKSECGCDSDLCRAASRNSWRDSGDYNVSPSGFARPASRVGHRLLSRSNSFDGAIGNVARERGRRRPSRLRHAIFIPGSLDDGLAESGELIRSLSNEGRPRSTSRGRQYVPPESPPEELDQKEQPNISENATSIERPGLAEHPATETGEGTQELPYLEIQGPENQSLGDLALKALTHAGEKTAHEPEAEQQPLPNAEARHSGDIPPKTEPSPAKQRSKSPEAARPLPNPSFPAPAPVPRPSPFHVLKHMTYSPEPTELETKRRSSLPLSMETIKTRQINTTPSLCSATSASTFDDNADHELMTPQAALFGEEKEGSLTVLIRDRDRDRDRDTGIGTPAEQRGHVGAAISGSGKVEGGGWFASPPPAPRGQQQAQERGCA
ncbi:hypothetical protein VTI74DRAFT_5821 [Chaetomium olivicolor]